MVRPHSWLLVTLDQHSLAIIPDMSRSNKDKITLLMSGASREYRGFGSFAYNRVTVQNELPVFARYLLDLKIPQQYWDPYKRFGVVAWQHPSLTQHIEASDWATSLVENIAMLFGGAEGEAVTAARLRKGGCTDEDRLYFIGTSSELFRLLCDNNNVFAREYTSSQAFGRNLQRLSDQGWDCKSLTKPGGENKAVASSQRLYPTRDRHETSKRNRRKPYEDGRTQHDKRQTVHLGGLPGVCA